MSRSGEASRSATCIRGQVLPGQRRTARDQRGRCSLEDDAAAIVAGTRSEIDALARSPSTVPSKTSSPPPEGGFSPRTHHRHSWSHDKPLDNEASSSQAGGPLTSVTLALWAVPEALTQPIVTVLPG